MAGGAKPKPKKVVELVEDPEEGAAASDGLKKNKKVVCYIALFFFF